MILTYCLYLALIAMILTVAWLVYVILDEERAFAGGNPLARASAQGAISRRSQPRAAANLEVP